MFAAFGASPPPRQLFFQYNNIVWWGTAFGLNRFLTTNELWGNIRPESVNDLCLDDPELWVATDRGALYADLRYLDWKSYTAKQGLPSDTVVRLVVDPDYVYAAGPHGLARFNKVVMQWEPMGNFADKRIYDLYSNQSQLWVATDQGVFYFDKKFEKMGKLYHEHRAYFQYCLQTFLFQRLHLGGDRQGLFPLFDQHEGLELVSAQQRHCGLGGQLHAG